MKYAAFILVLISSFCSAQMFEYNTESSSQFFEEDGNEVYDYNQYRDDDIYSDVKNDLHRNTENFSFFKFSGDSDEPDIGEDAGAPNPSEPVPIDNWIFLLTLTAVVTGFYFLKNKEEFYK